MLATLQTISLLLLATAMALALAHALELPGKMRLSKEQYIAVQPIYYPGFTIGGAAEPLAIMALALLAFITPAGGPAFLLTLASLAALVAMHAAYWLVTHPVNNFWLANYDLRGAGARFFAFDPLRRSRDGEEVDWTQLRDRWEYSHVLRAGFGLLSFVLLALAVAI